MSQTYLKQKLHSSMATIVTASSPLNLSVSSRTTCPALQLKRKASNSSAASLNLSPTTSNASEDNTFFHFHNPMASTSYAKPSQTPSPTERCTKKSRICPSGRFQTSQSSSSSSPYQQQSDTLASASYFHQPHLLTNESSYSFWLEDIHNYVTGTYPGYLVTELLPANYSENEKYSSKLATANTLCSRDPSVNQILNQNLLSSMDPQWHRYFTASNASENLELIKAVIQSKICASYLLELESHLQFQRENPAQFQRDIESLSRIYYIVFREPANCNLKLQWTMNALNKNPISNRDIISDIAMNWGVVYKNYGFVATILANTA